MTRLDELGALFAADGRFAQLEEQVRALHGGNGGGTSGGMSDDWKGGVDRQLGQLHQDIRHLLLGGIGAVILVVGFIGGLYVRTDDKFDAADRRLSAIEVETARSGAKLDRLLDDRATAERAYAAPPGPSAARTK